MLFKSPKEQIYPLDTAGRAVDFSISESDWQSLQNGGRLQMTSNTNLFGERELTSYVLIPFSVNRTDFYGVMVVSQSASNILNLVSAFNQNLFKSLLDFDHCFAIDQLSIRDFPSSADQSDEAGNQRNYEWEF